VTADTGGHIAYVLDAAAAQAALPEVESVRVVTRLFDAPTLGSEHALAREPAGPKLTVERVATARRDYLEKEALAAEVPAFTRAFLGWLARQDRPHLIHAHFADAAAVAAAARARFGIPFVYTPHALGIDKRAQGVAAPGLDARVAQEADALALADAVIVSSRDEAERQVGAYGVAGAAARTRRVPPGIPALPPPPAPGSGRRTLADRLGEWLDRPGLPVLLAVARPVAKKNIAGLLRACAGAPELAARANVVVLAGQHGRHNSAEERQVLTELHALAATPALRGRVALPPAHDALDVAALYARASRGGAFVNPALHEPFGLTLLEAAAAGVPVVATRSGGPAEIVERIGHGLLVDPRDDAAVAAACLRLVSDAGLHARLADAARANAGRYDWNSYAAASVALYREAAAVGGAVGVGAARGASVRQDDARGHGQAAHDGSAEQVDRRADRASPHGRTSLPPVRAFPPARTTDRSDGGPARSGTGDGRSGPAVAPDRRASAAEPSRRTASSDPLSVSTAHAAPAAASAGRAAPASPPAFPGLRVEGDAPDGPDGGSASDREPTTGPSGWAPPAMLPPSPFPDADRGARTGAGTMHGAGTGTGDRPSRDGAASGASRPALLACDIDGTLTGCADGARAFAAWRAGAGLPFAVATGRSLAAARAVLAAWDLPEPDAYITDVGTRLHRSDGAGGWAECPRYAEALDLGWDRAAAARALAVLGVEAQPADAQGPHKISLFGDPDQAEAARAALAAAGCAARLVYSHNRFIDVLAPAGGKAAAVAAWALEHGLTLADCVAAGDSGNDVDMLEACGRAIAVATENAGELAGLTPRPGLYRAARAHAGGVLEGLAAMGLAVSGPAAGGAAALPREGAAA